MHSNLILATLFILGMLFYMLRKVKKLNKKSGGFKLIPFLKEEWPTMLSDLIFMAILLITKSELSSIDNLINKLGLEFEFTAHIGLSFAFFGYGGASIAYGWLGRAEKKAKALTGDTLPGTEQDTSGN